MTAMIVLSIKNFHLQKPNDLLLIMSMQGEETESGNPANFVKVEIKTETEVEDAEIDSSVLKAETPLSESDLKEENRVSDDENNYIDCDTEDAEDEDQNSETHKYPCPKCGKRFTQHGSLKIHVNSIHDGVKFPCHVCQYQATTRHSLKTHIKSKHEGVKETCKKCGKLFATPSNLRSHIKAVHDGVKFNCKECEKQFTNQSNLRTHIQTFHEFIKFACQQCDMYFTQHGHLRKGFKNKVLYNNPILLELGSIKQLILSY